MFNIQSNRAKINPWSDDHPEKPSQTSYNSTSISKQLGDLVNPVSMIDQLFGAKKSHEQAAVPTRKEVIKSTKETTVFSFRERSEDRHIRQETQYIVDQLKKQITLLEKSEKSLSSEIAKIKVEQIPQKTGIYYLRYFEWLIGIVKNLITQVEEGRTWLAAFTQRKKRKIGYWKMYKKHGTTFGLSHERTLATQTG